MKDKVKGFKKLAQHLWKILEIASKIRGMWLAILFFKGYIILLMLIIALIYPIKNS